MNFLTLVASVLFMIVATDATDKIDNDELKCLVCRTIEKEMNNELSKTDPNRKADLGSFRLDGKGNEIKKTVPLVQSAIYISEVLDNTCKKMADYAKARYKDSKKLTLLNLVSPDGKLNADISEVDIIQDGDLNKSLEYLCDDIAGDEEDTIIQYFQKKEEDRNEDVCSNICDEEEREDHEEL